MPEGKRPARLVLPATPPREAPSKEERVISLAFRILGTAAILSTVPVLLRARQGVRATTLTTAWTWGVAALAGWGAVWGVDMLAGAVEAPVADQLWYAVSVVMLCPPIAVLGARRPGSRVWNAFVLVPLLLVLSVPALTAWNREWEVDLLRIEAPAAVGYGLVLVMGLGNYLGTRFALPGLLLGAAEGLLLVPLLEVEWLRLAERAECRIGGTILLAAALWGGAFCARARQTHAGYNRLWIDFRDQFGLVWAKRIQDRVNDTASKEGWPVRLEMHGFRRADASAEAVPEDLHDPRIDHALRWLLRRFVDSDWIDARLGRRGPIG